MFALRSVRVVLAAIACMATVMWLSIAAEAASCPGAGTVKNAANSFTRAAQAGSASAFSAALTKHTDVEALALFALGRYRDRLPADRRREYASNARRYMSQFLANHADRFRWSGLTVQSCKDNLVQTALSEGFSITSRVSGDRIQDVRLSGFWLALELRAQFTNIIKRERGDVGDLIDYLGRLNVASN
jgi:ABC-type transporter MlaC component